MNTAAILLTLGLVACAAAPKRDAKPAPVTPLVADAGVADMTPAAGTAVPSLDDLARQGAALLMHEVKRAADLSAPVALETAQADACFRASVGASYPVRSWFIDKTGAIRGEIAERDGAFLVPPRGPVCAKKGETLRLVVMAPSAGTVTRAVVFASP